MKPKSIDLSRVMRSAFSPARSRRVADVLHALNAWHGRITLEKRNALQPAWEDLMREVSYQLTKQ